MANVPIRSPLAMPYRKVLAFLEKWIVLPHIRPAYYDITAILLSVLFFVITSAWLKILILFLIILTDWLDGATARRYYLLRKEGYLMDVLTDRASEGLVFVSAIGTLPGKVFFLLWMINVALGFYSLLTKKHTSLPLRCVYLIVLIIQAWQGYLVK
jgi:phosphatidylglycerophosphate synthase